MAYLIDTHVLIWYVTGNERLSQKFVEKIQDPFNTIFISKISLWEIAIKVSIGKLSMGISFNELEQYLKVKQFLELEFNYADLEKLLPLPLHHQDPFDRLIISQAITRDLTIITDDNKFHHYPVQLL